MIEPGSDAPDFTLRDQDGQKFTLSEHRGKTIVLVFYPADFSPVCTDQLNVYQEVLSEFDGEGARLYGVSVDSAFCHKAFRDHIGVQIPLLADYHPKGAVSEQFGMYLPERGHATRGFVVIDPEGRVKHSHISPSPLEIPGANLIFDALSA